MTSWFGGGVTDYTIGGTGEAVTVGARSGETIAAVGGAEITLWNAQTGGTQYTDGLVDVTGTPVSSVVSSTGTASAALGQIPVFGLPDGVVEVWASADGGPRALMVAHGYALPLAGGQMTGPLLLDGDPVAPAEAASRGFVEGYAVPKSGGTMTGALTLPSSPTNPLHAATKGYVDQAAGGTYLYARGVNMAGGEFGFTPAGLPGVEGTDYAFDSLPGFVGVAARGHRIVRLPFRWERIQPTRGAELDATHLARLREVLDHIRTAGMTAVLDVHNRAEYIDSVANGGATRRLGTSALPGSDLVDLWDRLSEAFAGNPAVYAYGLMSEPHDMPGVPGEFTGTTRYDWNDGTVQGWTGDSATAAHVGGKLRLSANVGSGGVNFRKDDAETLRGGVLVGDWLQVEATLDPGVVGTWLVSMWWQTQGFSWQFPTSTTYVRVDTGEQVTSLIPGVAVRVTSKLPAIVDPNAFAIQVESPNAVAGLVGVEFDNFAQGTVTGEISPAVQWEQISQQVVDTIRARGDQSLIMVDGYDWAGAKRWPLNHPDPWIVDPADNIKYEAHYYFDTDGSGQYAQTYAAENAAAITGGYASLTARAVDELNNWLDWLDTHGVRGFMGEIGWPNTGDTAGWNAVGEALYDLLDAAAVDATQWAAGARWGANAPLSVYTGTAQDVIKSQAAVIEAHPSVRAVELGGGFLYGEAGALKWRSPAGVVTTVVPA